MSWKTKRKGVINLIYDVSKDSKLLEKQVTKNFKVKEFRCADGSPIIKIYDQFIKALQKLRDKIGLPIAISSGYRTKSYNSTCKGAIDNSEHTKGKAADIKISVLTPLQVAELADSLKVFSGIGVYPTFTHVDTGNYHGYWYQDSNSKKTFYATIKELQKAVKKG